MYVYIPNPGRDTTYYFYWQRLMPMNRIFIKYILPDSTSNDLSSEFNKISSFKMKIVNAEKVTDKIMVFIPCPDEVVLNSIVEIKNIHRPDMEIIGIKEFITDKRIIKKYDFLYSIEEFGFPIKMHEYNYIDKTVTSFKERRPSVTFLTNKNINDVIYKEIHNEHFLYMSYREQLLDDQTFDGLIYYLTRARFLYLNPSYNNSSNWEMLPLIYDCIVNLAVVPIFAAESKVISQFLPIEKLYFPLKRYNKNKKKWKQIRLVIDFMDTVNKIQENFIHVTKRLKIQYRQNFWFNSKNFENEILKHIANKYDRKFPMG